MGFKSNHLGYKYIVKLINIGISGKQILPLNSFGYTYLAKLYQKTTRSIAKNIENAISYVLTFGNTEFVYEVFKESINEESGKPTNKQFIMTLLDYILNYSK